MIIPYLPEREGMIIPSLSGGLRRSGPTALRSATAPLGTALGEGKHRLSLPLVGGIYHTFEFGGKY